MEDLKRKHKLDCKRKWISAKRSLSRKYEHDQDASTSLQSDDDKSDHGDSDDYHVAGNYEHCGADDIQCDASACTSPSSDIDGDVTNSGTCAVEWTWDRIDHLVILSSDSDSETGEFSSLEGDLATWVNTFQVKHNAVDGLLTILQKHSHSELPSTARTLLKTKRTIHTELKSGMEYIYLNIKQKLVSNFFKYPEEVRNNVTVLDISFNIDGIPLFSSSQTSLWPILCGICLDPVIVFPVAITLGKGKPADLDFLLDTCDDNFDWPISLQTTKALTTWWPKSNPTGKVKKGALPDKAKWTQHKIRVFNYVGSLERANQLSKRAEDTSNLDSAPENLGERQKRIPSRFRETSEENEHADDEEEMREEPSYRPIVETPTPLPLPVPPREYQPNSTRSFASPICSGATGTPLSGENSHVTTPSPALTSRSADDGREVRPTREMYSPASSSPLSVPQTPDTFSPVATSPLSVPLTPDMYNHATALPLSVPLTKHRYNPATSSPFSVFQAYSQGKENSVFNGPAHTRTHPPLGGTPSTASSTDRANGNRQSVPHPRERPHPRRLDYTENFTVGAIMRLDTLIENQKEIMMLLRQLTISKTLSLDVTTEDIDDILPKPVESVEELESLSTRLLEDAQFKKKMICYLTSLGGFTASDTVRRFFIKLGTNGLWSKYSLKGRKGKLKFQDLEVCRVVIKACIKIHATTRASLVEELICETLKHAPNKKGGNRFKEPAARIPFQVVPDATRDDTDSE